MYYKRKGRDQGNHGVQGLQGHPEERVAFDVSGTQEWQRYLKVERFEENLVSLLRHSPENDAYVCVFGNF